MPEGYLVLVLHAHLPYVLSHGKWPHGTDWLHEAACETYIPLLNLLGAPSRKERPSHFTIGITPVLCEMLASRLFRTGLKAYMGEKIRAALLDRGSFEGLGQKGQALLAERWRDFYESRLADFTDVYKEDLLASFRQFQEEGKIELIVSAATHAYLPLLGRESSIDAQIGQGIATYRAHFSREPEGMWLPECAYRPEKAVPGDHPDGRALRGIEAVLAAHTLKYFFIDGDQLPRSPSPLTGYVEDVGRGPALREEGAARGMYGPFAALPAALSGKGTDEKAERTERAADLYAIHTTGRPGAGEVAFFARDTDTSHQVWSGQWGYPGDPYYLEFHKKHTPGGLRYWRVTDHLSDLGTKEAYEPDMARDRVQEHARHFAALVEGKLRRYRRETGRTGVLTLTFDAELFGHWWFEGIEWLGALASAFDGNYVTIEKASTALRNIAPLGTISLPEGSWGEGGHHLIWYNKETAWTWECLYEAERDMEAAARKASDDEISARLLRQMARELFLLQSSDWQFLISTKTAGDYGESRFLGHYHAFKELGRMLDSYRGEGALGDGDRRRLAALEERDALFGDVKLDWFKERTEDGL